MRLSARSIRIIDERILYISKCIPNTFARRCRPTSEVMYYKYTELRQILLYSGKVIFRDLMASDAQYNNFLKYSVACTLLVDPETAQTFADLHHLLLREVVDEFSSIYAQAFMTYNAHVNLHLSDMANFHGSLDEISAYPFENHLRILKNCVTTSHNPLTQMVKGVERRRAVENGIQLCTPLQKIHTKEPNNVYIDHRRHICYEAQSQSQDSVKCVQHTETRPYFEEPIDSKIIGCYQVSLNRGTIVYLSVEHLLGLRRGMKINLRDMPQGCIANNAVIMALLHNQQDSLF